MNFIKRFWILEISLLLIAAGGLGLAAYNTFTFDPQAATAEEAGGAPAAVSTIDIQPVDAQVVAAQEAAEVFEAEENDDGGEEEGEDFEGDEDEFWHLDAAAQFMGMNVETLEELVANGRSLADVAAENGVDVDALTADLISQELAFIDAQVAKGALPTEDAAEWQAEAQAWTEFWVTSSYREPDVVAAEMLGIDVEAFWEALDQGETVQMMAESRNIDPQMVVDTLTAAEADWVDQMVAAEMVDAEERDEILADANEWVTRLVTLPVDQWEVEEDEEDEA